METPAKQETHASHWSSCRKRRSWEHRLASPWEAEVTLYRLAEDFFEVL